MEYLIELFNQIVTLYNNATPVEVVAYVIPASFILWILFVNIMVIKNILLVKYPTGLISKILWAILIPLAIIGYLYDVLFNITYGSLIFWSLPKLDKLTLSQRMKDIIRDEPESRRGKLSIWICTYLVEPWDPGHCRLDRLN